MKKTFYNLFLVAGITLASVSCKNDKENTVTPNEATDAAEASEESANYNIDTDASTMKWRGTKPTGEHIGSIKIEDGSLAVKDGELESGKVIIDMTSLSVEDEGLEEKDRTSLENHLKGTVEGKETDFFNVEKFPTATFEITGTTEKDGQTFLQGNLTLKETTKNIEFPIKMKMSNDGQTLRMKSDKFMIDRTVWGVNYGSKSVFDNLGDNFISDEMEISFSVEANRE